MVYRASPGQMQMRRQRLTDALDAQTRTTWRTSSHQAARQGAFTLHTLYTANAVADWQGVLEGIHIIQDRMVSRLYRASWYNLTRIDQVFWVVYILWPELV